MASAHSDILWEKALFGSRRRRKKQEADKIKEEKDASGQPT